MVEWKQEQNGDGLIFTNVKSNGRIAIEEVLSASSRNLPIFCDKSLKRLKKGMKKNEVNRK